MKKSLLAAAVAAALLAPQVVGAEGFGIVEWSAQGTAMGGARMFAENDAAMVAYNPASITKVDNMALSFHGTSISPHGKYNVNNGPEEHNRVSAGLVPGAFFVKKIGEKDWIGLGSFTRFGMVSEFEKSSLAAISANKSKMIGTSITPVYAHKFDKKWSAAVGAEINYVNLVLEKHPGVANEKAAALTGYTPEQIAASGNGSAMSDFKVEGSTWAMGWNAAVNYSFDDKNEIGVVYRSKISQNMQNADLNVGLYNPSTGKFVNRNGNASAKVVLPDTWSIGYGHKFNNRTRVELNATRTNWHTYETLDMRNNTLGLPLVEQKNWKDGWRYAIGVEHKLSKKYNLLFGLSYDGSCIPAEHADFMVPTGNRKTITVGTEYHDERQTFAFTLGYMFIGSQDVNIATGLRAHTYDNNAPIISIGYQLNF